MPTSGGDFRGRNQSFENKTQTFAERIRRHYATSGNELSTLLSKIEQILTVFWPMNTLVISVNA